MASIPGRLEVQMGLLGVVRDQTAIYPVALEYDRDTDTGLWFIKGVHLSWDHFVALASETIK